MFRVPVVAVIAALLSGVGSQVAAAADGVGSSTARPTFGGLAYGLDMLSMSNELCIGGEIGVPVSGVVSVVVRPMVLGGGSPSSFDAGGRIELRFQTSVHDDRLRAYFGAGPQGFYELRGNDVHHTDVSGGWDVGLEFFADDHLAFHWEMGTSGGGVFGAAGPVFAVGVNVYPRGVRHRA